jgi:hypothetical protein
MQEHPEGTGGNACTSRWKGEQGLKSNFRFIYIFILVLVSIIVLAAVGCSAGGTTASTSTGTNTSAGVTSTTSSDYSIAVIVNGKQTATLTPADLGKLPQVKANVGGTDEQGPTFMSAMNSIGVTNFTEVTVSGFTQGRVATADLTLKKAEITDNVMLALVKRGTVKLTGTDIGAQKAIIDVNKIVVK